MSRSRDMAVADTFALGGEALEVLVAESIRMVRRARTTARARRTRVVNQAKREADRG